MEGSRRYRIRYITHGNETYVTYVNHPKSEYTLRYLTLGSSYSISVSPGYSLSQYTGGDCHYSYFYGEYNEPVVAETRESGMYSVLCRKKYIDHMYLLHVYRGLSISNLLYYAY